MPEMSDIQDSRRRLADLIWRTIKLRILILTLSIIVLLVVWSALLSGNQQASRIDIDFCRTLTGKLNQLNEQTFADINASHPTQKPIFSQASDPNQHCTASNSRNWIEAEHSALLMIHKISASSDAQESNYEKSSEVLESDYEKYKMDRLAAFGMRINLSSEFSQSAVEGNSLAIAEIVPFCVILAMAIVLILGFQEGEYRRNLRGLLQHETGPEHDLALSEGQFFARNGRFQLGGAGRRLVLAPERITMGALLLSTLVLLLKVLSVFLSDLLHLTDTIFFSYPFRLYTAVAAVTAVVVQTWRSYRSPNPPPFLQWTLPPLIEKWAPICLVTCASLCFVAPWAVSGVYGTIRGFEFVLSDPVKDSFGAIKFYAISRSIYAETQLQVWLVIAFLTANAVCALNRIRTLGKWMNFVVALSRTLSAIISFIAVYYLIYMGILQYEWMSSTPLQDLALLPMNGYSMMFYSPCLGFWILLTCCFALVWFSFRDDKSVSAMNDPAPPAAPSNN